MASRVNKAAAGSSSGKPLELKGDELDKKQYDAIARVQYMLRCVEGYFNVMISIDDKMGMAIFSLAVTDPLQFLQFEYDNFSGLKSLSIPRRHEQFSTATTFIDTSKKLVNMNASNLLNSKNMEQLNVSDEAVRLLTGRIPAKVLVTRQKELFRQEMTIKGKSVKSGKQNFLTWYGLVGSNMYREYRINSDMICAPGCMTSVDTDEDRETIVRAFIKKRIHEMPQYKKHYNYLAAGLCETKVLALAAAFVSPYSLITRFELENFASNYEWTKPKPFYEFESCPGKVHLIRCKITDLSPVHHSSEFDGQEQQVIDAKIEQLQTWIAELKTSVEACIQIINLVATYCNKKEDTAIADSMKRTIDGLFYGIHVLHYRERQLQLFGEVSEQLLTIVLHCFDPDAQLTENEICFLEMWNFKTIDCLALDIAYASNFFETARRESLSERNSRKTRTVYRKICECLPKMGGMIREKTRTLREGIPIEKLVKYL